MCTVKVVISWNFGNQKRCKIDTLLQITKRKWCIAYQMVAHHCKIFRMHFSYNSAAVDKISTDMNVAGRCVAWSVADHSIKPILHIGFTVYSARDPWKVLQFNHIRFQSHICYDIGINTSYISGITPYSFDRVIGDRPCSTPASDRVRIDNRSKQNDAI